MNYALASTASSTCRSTLFGLVIAAHAGVFLLLATARTVLPQVMEMPLVVDLLAAPVPPEAPKPQPVVKPTPVRPPTPAEPHTPPLDASRSSVPAAQAPSVAVPDKPVAAPAATAEVASPARFDADYLKNPPPPYPPLSRRMGEEGQVMLRVLVNAQGSADSVEIKTSSGSTRLDSAAVDTVKRWKFVPAKRGEVAVPSAVLVPIIFKLEQ